jgi:hypothetical protein
MGEPTQKQIAAYKRGEQKLWYCPECGEQIEVLSALMVFCDCCRRECKKLTLMVRVDEEASRV